MKFSGSVVPLITPFTQKMRIDTDALENLIEWHIHEGSDAIIVCATTGEGLSLAESEKKRIVQIAKEVANRRIPILVSTGLSDTKMTVKQTEKALKFGADGSLIVTPFYNRPSQRGCILHFKEVAKVGLPIILYHNPSRACVHLSAETILELSSVKNIVGIKESGHNLDLIRKIAPSISVFSGDDDIAFYILQGGGVGTISTISNLIPCLWKKMVSFCLNQKWEEAKKLQEKVLPLIKAIFLETNPQGIKFALSRMGHCLPTLRLPLVLPEEKTQKAIKQELTRLNLSFS